MQVFKYNSELGIQQYCKYTTFEQTIQESAGYADYEHYFLLDEGRFHFFRFDIYRQLESSFTIDDFNKILQDRVDYLKSITKEELLFTNVDNIFVDGVPQKYLIGAKGEVFFRLCLIYINRNSLLAFNARYGDLFEAKRIHVFPESFKTISFLKRKLERDNFYLLYIQESWCKIIQVQDWFYKRIEQINLWVSFLMQMYRENQIVKYRYQPSEEIDQNPLAKNLVMESIDFYVSQLCRRLQDLDLVKQDIFIISPIIKNWYFMELFNKKYSAFHGRYIVPFHSSSYLSNFGRQRDPSEMDLLVFLNGKPLKQKLLQALQLPEVQEKD